MESKRNWEKLPIEIMAMIINNMNPRDQLNMATTCKTWLNAFSIAKNQKFKGKGDGNILVDSKVVEPILRCWDELPAEMLVHIFHFMSPSSRFAASVTCKYWEEIFQCSMLWYSFSCIFTETVPDELLTKRLPTAFWSYGINNQQIARHCASDLKYLWIYADQYVSYTVRRTISGFFDSLASWEVQLFELHLTTFNEWKLDHEAGIVLVVAIANFLRTQQHLIVLHVKWSTHVFLATILLEALSSCCTHSLKELSFTEVTSKFRSPHRNPFFQKYIAIWDNLKKLSLNYESINAAILIAICEKCKTTLKDIYFYFHDFSQDKVVPLHTIEKRVWKMVKKMIPDLKVGFRLDDSTNLANMERVLCTEIPLAHINIKKIFNDCFGYLKRNFADTLETLKCQPNTDDMVMTKDMIGSVTELVSSATHLRSLTITAKVSNGMIENLCSLQNRDYSGFDLYIHLLKLSEAEKTAVRELQSRMNANGKQHKLYLRFF